MTERFRFLQGGFRRLRAASDFARGGKVTKTPPGDAADGHFVPIGPLTPGPPFTGVTPWGGQNISGAQNQECLGAVPSGPLGPGFVENWSWCGSAFAPGFAEPTLPVCFLCRGDPRGRPQAFPFRGRPIPPNRGEWLKAKRGRGAGRRPGGWDYESGPFWDRPLRRDRRVSRYSAGAGGLTRPPPSRRLPLPSSAGSGPSPPRGSAPGPKIG